MKFRKQATSKLFYGKWPYKIECVVDGAYRIKRQGIGPTLAYCLSNDDPIPYYRRPVNKTRLRDFANDVEPFLREEIQLRCEGDHFNLFCKDLDLYKRLCRNLEQYITVAYEPSSEEELTFMINNGHKKVVCNQLPYETYQYRVFFKPGCDVNVKGNFESWISNYMDRVRIPAGTIKWFSTGWRPAPFMYVIDKATLSMIGLFMGSNIHKVEEFIPRSSINTCLNQEQVCQDSA